MASVLTKIQALLALSTSSNIDEARNAALAAARLIREHKVVLVLPAQGAPVTFPEPSIRVQAKKTKPVIRRDSLPEGWKYMKAKFDGTCARCKGVIPKDAMIMWSKDHGAYHPTCYVKRRMS